MTQLRQQIPTIILTVIVIVLVLVPILMLVAGSFMSVRPGAPGASFTLGNYWEAFSSGETYELLYNTLVFASGKTILAIILATSLAWIVTRTNTPFAKFFEFIAVVPFMMPILLAAVAWLFLLSPRVGYINTVLMWLFRLEHPPFDALSMPGLIFVSALYSTPLCFLIISAALKSMDPSLEEAGQVLGSGVYTTMLTITLPLVKNAIIAAALLSFIVGIESFEIPAVLGLPAGIYVYTTKIVYSLRHAIPPLYGLATSYAMLILVICMICLFFYRRMMAQTEKFVTVAGRAYHPRIIDIGRWKYATFAYCAGLLGLMAVLPMFALIIFSLLPFMQPLTGEVLSRLSFENYVEALTYPAFARAFTNSLALAFMGATICMFLTSFVSYSLFRTRPTRGKGFLEAAATSGFAIPATIFGVGMLWAYIPLPIAGTIWVLLIGYVGRWMAFGLRFISTSMVQIHKELEDSSRVLGASWTRTYVKVLLPLVKPGFLSGWIFLFLIFLRELGMSILLYTRESQVLSIVIWDFIETGWLTSVASIGVVLIIISMAAYLIVMLIQRYA